jgi:hypothetical protein
LVARLKELGAEKFAPADVGQGDVPWQVLADPEGNEFASPARRGAARLLARSHS